MPSTTVEIKGKDNTSRAFNSVNRAIGGLKTGVLAIGTAVAGTTVAFGAWANSMRDTVDRIGKVSAQIGISAEQLQKFQFAAGQGGVAIGAFDKGLQKFSKNISEALQGTKAQKEAFEGLNVSIKNAKGDLKPLDQLFLEVAESFFLLGDEASTTTIAMDLFGLSGIEMLPMLKSGSNSIQLLGKRLELVGGVISNDAVPATESFNDNIDLLSNKFKNKFNDVIIFANEVIKQFTKEERLATASLKEKRNAIQEEIENLADLRKTLKETIPEQNLFTKALKLVGVETKNEIPEIQNKINELVKQRNELDKLIPLENERIEQQRQNLKEAIKNKKIKEDSQKVEDKLADDLFVTNDAIETQSGLVKDLTVNYEELLIQKQNQIDKNAELFEEEKDFLDDLEKEYQKKDFAYAKMVENRIIAEKKLQEEATRTSLNSIASLSAGVKDESDDLFYLYQATSIGQAIMSTYESATKALTAGPYLGPIMAGIIYGLGMANVNKIRKEKPPSQRYMGGNVSAGKQYLVGERGPEILQMGRSGGNIIPNDKMGGGTNVMINISAVDARGIDALLNERKDTLVGIINQSLHRQTRRAI